MKKKHILWLGVGFAALAIVVGTIVIRKPDPVRFVSVERGSIASTIGLTGTVEASAKADLAFERAGKIASIRVNIGDHVAANQDLALLDVADLQADLAQAVAARDAARARLLQLQKGTRPEEIAIAQTTVSNAETDLKNVIAKATVDLANTYDKARDTLSDAYTKSEDAVRVKTLGMFTGSMDAYRLTFESCNYQAQIDAERLRSTAEEELTRWRTDLANLSAASTDADYDRAIISTRARMATIRLFLQRTNDTVTGSCAVNDTTTSTYRTNINTALTNVSTATSAVATLQQSIATQKSVNQNAIAAAQSTLASAKNQFALKKAGATPEDIAAQAALAQEADARIMSVRAQLAKTVIRAPFSGIISRQDAKIGQIATANTPLVSIISDAILQITANVPEVSAAYVAPGNPVSITLDALPGETLTGHVQSIEPAETIIDGVSNYKTTIIFDAADPRIKSGFTANLSIETARVSDALLVPNDTITENERGTFVQKNVNGAPTETAVKIGIRSTSGKVQITEGLSAGDQVVAPAEKK